MTSTEIVRLEPRQVVRVADEPPMSWPDMVRMGDQLVKTGMMPEHVRDGAQAALIMLTGRELGMQPMRALRSLQVVKGKVVESADSQLARFKSDGGRSEFKHLDETKAILWLRHPNGDEHTETWTSADTQKAGLSGGMHSKFTKAMYRSRAITAGLKSVGWEGGVGNYDPDEARAFTGKADDVEVQPPPAAKAPKAKRESGATKAQAETIKQQLAALGITEERGAYLDAILPGASTTAQWADVIRELAKRVEAIAKPTADGGAESKAVPTPAASATAPSTPAPPSSASGGTPAAPTPTGATADSLKPLTDEQRMKILSLMDKGGARDGEARCKIASGIIDREVRTLVELTSTEADTVIAALKGPPPAAA